ncbi:hypothetical protein [Lysinibacillus xylanilyticus]|uniref:Preprotein translocase subunit SecB n=1 Tax=Lysinibacillus xylanilyticus TaxID=582475 RepID=A0ABV3W042_9BACI
MANQEFLNELNFQRNSIQLRDVELLEIKFTNIGIDEYKDLPFQLNRHAEIEEKHVNIYLIAIIGDEEKSGFNMEVKYKGEVYSVEDEMGMEELKNYALQHVIPMLLPYVREVSSSIINRTDLPYFMLPTLDVINYLKSIRENE